MSGIKSITPNGFTGNSLRYDNSASAGFADIDTVFLANFDVDINDSSAYARAGTVTGTAAIVTDQSIYGTKSMYSDASSYVKYTASMEPLLLAGSWTVEAWVRQDGTTSGAYPGACGNGITTWSAGFVGMRINNNNLGRCGLHWNGYGDPLVWGQPATALGNTWHHFAIVGYAGGAYRVFSDGTPGTLVVSATTPAINWGNNGFVAGVNATGSLPAHGFKGWINGLRISKVARYTNAFTPSTKPFLF
jgi:hypothetical protein